MQAQLELSEQNFIIIENESKTKFELNEDSFLVNESEPYTKLEFSEENFLSQWQSFGHRQLMDPDPALNTQSSYL